MYLNCDLHYHSGASGGVGVINLKDFIHIAPKKGINLIGTGDCLHPEWNKILQASLREIEADTGLFVHPDDGDIFFLLQTEVIFTCKIRTGRKSVHVLLLFPSFNAIDDSVKLMERWGMKNTIGRPFLKCIDNEDVGDKLLKLLNIDDAIEFIPAHVMTPAGVFGSNNPINYLEEFFGSATEKIHVVETGLSADPLVLGLIPELDDLGFISNSDAHSVALNRLGREFTTIEVNKLSYWDVLASLRAKKISRTSEFSPTEGKFFLTGHRAGKKGHGKHYCVFSPKFTPKDHVCPICKKKLTVGVLERALELTKVQGANREFGYLPPKSQKYVHMVPLIEILARGHFHVKSVSSKKVTALYYRIVQEMGNECELWFVDDSTIQERLQGIIDEDVIDLILKVKNGYFSFKPLGFDGSYGELVIGEKQDINAFFETNVISNQTRLF
ncbi:MAG: endonuclease Q family protein [Candidatus Helarchaeota archaeon]